MSRHLHTRLGRQNILALPKTRHRLRLRIKPNTRFPIKRIRPSARHTLLIAREAEHGQWNRDGDIDADLAGFDVLLEARGGAAGAGEDGDTVAVFVCVDEGDGFVDGGDVDADEDRAEDFLRVASHVGFYVGDDGGADLYSRSVKCGMLRSFNERDLWCLPSCHLDTSLACSPVRQGE